MFLNTLNTKSSSIDGGLVSSTVAREAARIVPNKQQALSKYLLRACCLLGTILAASRATVDETSPPSIELDLVFSVFRNTPASQNSHRTHTVGIEGAGVFGIRVKRKPYLIAVLSWSIIIHWI